MQNVYTHITNYLIMPTNIIVGILAIDYLIKGKKELQLFSYYLTAAFFTQIIQYLLAVNGIHNIFIFHIFTPLQFILIALNFYQWEKEYKELYKVSIGLLSILIILNCFHSFPKHIFNSTPQDMPITAMVITSIALFIMAVRALIVTPKDYKIYFVFGVLFYFSQSSGFFYLYQQTNIALPLLEHKFSVVISHLIFSIGYINGIRRRSKRNI